MKNILDKQGNLVAVQGVTMKGTLKYPHLTSVDYGTDDFPKEDGEFNTKIILSATQAEEFRASLSEIHELADELGKVAEAKRKTPARKKNPYALAEIGNPVYDEAEEETGEIEINFKTKASGIDKKTDKKWTKVLPIFDAKAKTIEDCPAIWGGTVAKLSFTTKPYFVAGTGQAGLAFYLNGVQVIDLVSGSGGASAEGMGFGEEEGFESEENSSDFEEESTEEQSAEDVDGEEDF